MLTAGDPVKNARALLRNSLPINNPALRTIQSSLEGISEQLRIPGSKALGPIARAVAKANGTLVGERAKISAAFAPDKKAAGDAALDKLSEALKAFGGVLEAKDKQGIPAAQNAALAQVTAAEEALVTGFPFTVPDKYAALPQLKGRATLEMKISLRTARQDGVKGGIMTMVADGFNAPVTAGNFVDLVSNPHHRARVHRLGLAHPDRVFSLLGLVLHPSDLVRQTAWQVVGRSWCRWGRPHRLPPYFPTTGREWMGWGDGWWARLESGEGRVLCSSWRGALGCALVGGWPGHAHTQA
jgi:hypothetical protein